MIRSESESQAEWWVSGSSAACQPPDAAYHLLFTRYFRSKSIRPIACTCDFYRLIPLKQDDFQVILKISEKERYFFGRTALVCVCVCGGVPPDEEEDGHFSSVGPSITWSRSEFVHEFY